MYIGQIIVPADAMPAGPVPTTPMCYYCNTGMIVTAQSSTSPIYSHI